MEKGIFEQEEQAENIDRFIVKVKAVYVHALDKSSGHRVKDVDISYDLMWMLTYSLLNNLYKLRNGIAKAIPIPENNPYAFLLSRSKWGAFNTRIHNQKIVSPRFYKKRDRESGG